MQSDLLSTRAIPKNSDQNANQSEVDIAMEIYCLATVSFPIRDISRRLHELHKKRLVSPLFPDLLISYVWTEQDLSTGIEKSNNTL